MGLCTKIINQRHSSLLSMALVWWLWWMTLVFTWWNDDEFGSNVRQHEQGMYQYDVNIDKRYMLVKDLGPPMWVTRIIITTCFHMESQIIHSWCSVCGLPETDFSINRPQTTKTWWCNREAAQLEQVSTLGSNYFAIFIWLDVNIDARHVLVKDWRCIYVDYSDHDYSCWIVDPWHIVCSNRKLYVLAENIINQLMGPKDSIIIWQGGMNQSEYM